MLAMKPPVRAILPFSLASLGREKTAPGNAGREKLIGRDVREMSRIL